MTPFMTAEEHADYKCTLQSASHSLLSTCLLVPPLTTSSKRPAGQLGAWHREVLDKDILVNVQQIYNLSSLPFPLRSQGNCWHMSETFLSPAVLLPQYHGL